MESLWSWLNTPPDTGVTLNPFGAVYFIVFAMGFVASAYLAGSGAERLARNPVQRAGVRHWASVGIWVFGPGLFFFAVRALQFNPLSFGEPIWLVGSVIALLVAAVRCVDWWRTVYPAELALRGPDGAGMLIPRPARIGSDPPATSMTTGTTAQT